MRMLELPSRCFRHMRGRELPVEARRSCLPIYAGSSSRNRWISSEVSQPCLSTSRQELLSSCLFRMQIHLLVDVAAMHISQDCVSACLKLCYYPVNTNGMSECTMTCSYRHTSYHKQTKHQWARDDPAFVIICCGLVACAAFAYCLA